ncbi:HesA/MoeB/ThiF family protein [Bacillus cytotoxicus]|uniref:HesA/MoeB/ThiF family protein n=1 Tax=Bacillus cytotoxicus TaxID=580165 RepID=UPI002447D57F|nr:ThiF family adenylyltransferase [Bacillus cytotoxicus]MDH2880196.1 ThiF family adenylyltransferase [Bacillus cytotoxicus]
MLQNTSKPRIKLIHQVLYLHGRVRIGGGSQHAIEIEDPNQYFKPLIKLLNGSYTIEEISHQLSETFSYEEIIDSINLLAENGYIEDMNISPNESLSENDLERYSVNINFFNTLSHSKGMNGYDYQAVLKDSKVLVFGLGGIGSNICMALTELGVGHITAVDFDQIALSNLNRQVLYSTSTVGELKTKMAKKRIMDFNPDIKFDVIDCKVSSLNNVEDIIHQVNPDFVFCLADKPNGYIDFWINEVCVKKEIPMVGASIGCSIGTAYSVTPNCSCYQCRINHDLINSPELVEELEYIRNNEVNSPNGALGPSCMFFAYYLSYEYLRYTLKLGSLLTENKLFEINFTTFEQKYHDMPKLSDCSICNLKPLTLK